MRRSIIVIGEINDTLKTIYDALVEEYQVQLVPLIKDVVYKMMRITKPNLVIVSTQADMETETEIIEWLVENRPFIPRLLIADAGRLFSERVTAQQKTVVKHRPITSGETLALCNRLLNAAPMVEAGREPAAGNAATQKPAVKHPDPNHKIKVMVVDDAAMVLRSMKQLLEVRYEVFLANSGEQAIKLLPLRVPDVILLDYEMGGMNGKETFEAIRQMPDMKDIPIIFLTGVSSKEVICEVLALKPEGYMLKPPAPKQLFDKIEEVLR